MEILIAIVGVLIASLLGVLGILATLYPKRAREICEDLKTKLKEFEEKHIAYQKIAPLINLIGGVLIIIMVANSSTIYTNISQDSEFHNGASVTCPRDQSGCFFTIPKEQMAYFKVKLKFDSINKLDLEFLSVEEQKIEIGIGEKGQYDYKEVAIGKTGEQFVTENIFEGANDKEICSMCQKNKVLNFLASIFHTEKYLAIKVKDDLKVRKIRLASIGRFNSYKTIGILIGVFYILFGFYYTIHPVDVKGD